jgi:uncharacterized protein YndB with AHSA1/START domain
MNAPVTELKDDTALMIRRTFKADIQTLWNALTDPKALMQWMGAHVATPVRAEADLRVGGKWFLEMEGKETGNPHNVRGEYVEIDEPNRVVFTWSWYSSETPPTLVTFALKDRGDGTTSLTLTHERFADADTRTGHSMGWNGSFDNLDTLLAA